MDDSQNTSRRNFIKLAAATGLTVATSKKSAAATNRNLIPLRETEPPQDIDQQPG